MGVSRKYQTVCRLMGVQYMFFPYVIQYYVLVLVFPFGVR